MSRPIRPPVAFSFLMLTAVVMLGATSTRADVIAPTHATGTISGSWAAPWKLIDGSGLSGVGPILTQTHESIHTKGWLINNLDPANELVFTWVGETADLSGLYAWQYEQAGGCCYGRGVNTFDVSFSTDQGATFGTPISLALDQSSVQPGPELAQSRTFGTTLTGVTDVKFTNMTAFGDTWQGLNEVRFEGTTTPIDALAIGQPLTNRTNLDGPGNLFAAEGFGLPGSVNGYTIQGTTAAWGGTRTITPVIFEQTGAGATGAFTVRGIGTTRTLTHSAAPQSFNFGLVAGSDAMGPRRWFGYVDGAPDGTTSYGTISYDNTGGGVYTQWMGAGGTFGVDSATAVPTLLQRQYSLQVDITTDGEAVGNGASVRGTYDGAVGATFLHNDGFSTEGVLDQWAFYSRQDGRSVTPLLFEQSGSNFVLRAVGTTRTTGTDDGLRTYDFGLVSGNDEVGPNYYLGWKDGSVDSQNPGVIAFSQAPAGVLGGGIQYFGAGIGAGQFVPGTNFGAGTSYARDYSVQALAVPTPPSAVITWGDPVAVTSVSDVDPTGNVVRAVNLGGAAVSVDTGGETIDFATIGSTTDSITEAGIHTNAGVYAGSTGDANFDSVMDSFSYSGPNPGTLTLRGLSAGQAYQIQLFTSDDRDATLRARTQSFGDTAGGDPSATFAHGDSPYLIGTFTAVSNRQEILVTGVGQPEHVLNGYILRAVPEPSSVVLLLAGMIGLAGCARMRRRK